MRNITFRCVGCRARIKAPSQLRGQTRSCPGCGYRFVVQLQRPEDAGPALVYEGSSAGRTGPRHRYED
jgi:hypothetical protein